MTVTPDISFPGFALECRLAETPHDRELLLSFREECGWGMDKIKESWGDPTRPLCIFFISPRVKDRDEVEDVGMGGWILESWISRRIGKLRVNHMGQSDGEKAKGSVTFSVHVYGKKGRERRADTGLELVEMGVNVARGIWRIHRLMLLISKAWTVVYLTPIVSNPW